MHWNVVFLQNAESKMSGLVDRDAFGFISLVLRATSFPPTLKHCISYNRGGGVLITTGTLGIPLSSCSLLHVLTGSWGGARELAFWEGVFCLSQVLHNQCIITLRILCVWNIPRSGREGEHSWPPSSIVWCVWLHIHLGLFLWKLAWKFPSPNRVVTPQC